MSVPERLPEEVRAARMRSPEAGSAADGFTLEVAGSVVTRTGQARSVELHCDGTLIREIPVDIARPGMSRLDPDLPDTLVCGFRSLLGALVLPPEFELELVVVRDDGGRFPFASITGRRGRPAPSSEAALRSLLLTSVGRTGSVWMMGMLGAHPEIVVQDEYPYEVMPARYWGHMLQVLSGPADHVRSATIRNFDLDLGHVGQNPFYVWMPGRTEELGAWLGRAHVDRLAAFCRQNVEDWYAIAARDQGKEPVYFAEKNLLRTALQGLGVADLYPDTREVFLVRDFRDMACSWLSFRGHRWRETGFDTERALAEMVQPWAGLLVAAWRARREHAYLVRYEDLVFNAEETLKGLFDHLGIDSSDAVVARTLGGTPDGQVFTTHGTSATLEGTVGKWSREGDEPFGDALNQIFHEALVEFGYTEGAREPA